MGEVEEGGGAGGEEAAVGVEDFAAGDGGAAAGVEDLGEGGEALALDGASDDVEVELGGHDVVVVGGQGGGGASHGGVQQDGVDASVEDAQSAEMVGFDSQVDPASALLDRDHFEAEVAVERDARGEQRDFVGWRLAQEKRLAGRLVGWFLGMLPSSS